MPDMEKNGPRMTKPRYPNDRLIASSHITSKTDDRHYYWLMLAFIFVYSMTPMGFGEGCGRDVIATLIKSTYIQFFLSLGHVFSIVSRHKLQNNLADIS